MLMAGIKAGKQAFSNVGFKAQELPIFQLRSDYLHQGDYVYEVRLVRSKFFFAACHAKTFPILEKLFQNRKTFPKIGKTFPVFAK